MRRNRGTRGRSWRKEEKETFELLMIMMTPLSSLIGEIRTGKEAAGNISRDENDTCIVQSTCHAQKKTKLSTFRNKK